MLLFLDIISPIPEFCVIDDNKVILKEKIIQNEPDRLSDNIIQSYIEIDKRLNLTQNLKKISTTIGPGSYTSLRVGSAFISGLMISRKIPYYPLSIEDILNFNSIKSSKNTVITDKENNIEAIDNVLLVNEDDKIFINSGYALFNDILRYFTETPKISFLNKDDTLNINSEIVFSKKNILISHKDVKIISKNLIGKCDSLSFNQNDLSN